MYFSSFSPLLGITSNFVLPQTVHVYCLIPSEVAVGAVISTPSFQMWLQSDVPVFETISVFFSPHTVHVYVLITSEVSVGAVVIVPSSHV